MIAGFTCHARGVAIEAADARRARAIVKSQRPHTVDFRVVNGKLFVKCSCPAESMGVRACKHTWAALLEIDKQGALGELRTKRGPVVLERELDAPAKAAAAAPESEVKRKRGRPKKVAAAPPPAPAKKKARR